MALLGVQPWEEIGDFKFQAIAEGKNLDVVLQGWNLRDSISDEALDLLQVRVSGIDGVEGEALRLYGCVPCPCVRCFSSIVFCRAMFVGAFFFFSKDGFVVSGGRVDTTRKNDQKKRTGGERSFFFCFCWLVGFLDWATKKKHTAVAAA